MLFVLEVWNAAARVQAFGPGGVELMVPQLPRSGTLKRPGPCQSKNEAQRTQVFLPVVH